MKISNYYFSYGLDSQDIKAYNTQHMKSFIAGLLTIIALGLVGFYTFKATTKLMSNLNGSPTPTASASASPSSTPIVAVKPTSTPKAEPEAEGNATTKGGLPVTTSKIKGVSTIYTPVKKVTTTTTTSHLLLTLVKTSNCPISYMTEIKDITGPLTLKYKLADNSSFGITVWKRDGNELINNTTYSGNSGTIKTITGVDYMKVRVESKTCPGNTDNWLTVTAER